MWPSIYNSSPGGVWEGSTGNHITTKSLPRFRYNGGSAARQVARGSRFETGAALSVDAAVDLHDRSDLRIESFQSKEKNMITMTKIQKSDSVRVRVRWDLKVLFALWIAVASLITPAECPPFASQHSA